MASVPSRIPSEPASGNLKLSYLENIAEVRVQALVVRSRANPMPVKRDWPSEDMP